MVPDMGNISRASTTAEPQQNSAPNCDQALHTSYAESTQQASGATAGDRLHACSHQRYHGCGGHARSDHEKSTDAGSTRRPYRSPGHHDYHQKHDDDRASVCRALHEIGPSIEWESSGDKDATRRQRVHMRDSGISDLYARSTSWTDHTRRPPLVSGKKRGRGDRANTGVVVRSVVSNACRVEGEL
jgi:hypothetical protein